MERCNFDSHELIITQGDIGDYFYVLEQGKVAFIVNGSKVKEAQPGATFGELALLHHAPRAATVMAITDCCLYRVHQTTFRHILADNEANVERKRVQLLKSVEIFRGM